MERLRKYEDLLQQNNIKFEPLPKDASGQLKTNGLEGDADSDIEPSGTPAVDWPSPTTTTRSERVFETKYVYLDV